jgi:hypothetical protein
MVQAQTTTSTSKMPVITRRQQKMMDTNTKSDILKSDEMSNANATFKSNELLKAWFMNYIRCRLNELTEIKNTMVAYNQNMEVVEIGNVELYFKQLQLVNEMYYNINVYLEDIMNNDKPKYKYWLKLLKTIFIKQKDLVRSIMVSIEPTTDEEISIVKSTLLELEKSRTMAIRLLPENEINVRPVRRSVKAALYREMEEETAPRGRK